MSDPSTIFSTNLTGTSAGAWWRASDSPLTLALSDNTTAWDQKIAQWNDKSGNNFHLTAASNAFPTFDSTGPAVRIEYASDNSNAQDQFFTIPTAVVCQMSGCSMWAIIENDACYGVDSSLAPPQQTVISIGLTSANGGTGVKDVIQIVGGLINNNGTGSSIVLSGHRTLILLSITGSTQTMYVNGASVSGTCFFPTGTAVGGKLFAFDGVSTQHGKLKVLEAGVLTAHAATSTEAAAMLTYAQAYWKVPTLSEINRILIVGDSRGAGHKSRRPWHRRLIDSLDNTRVFPYAVPGYEASNQTSSNTSVAAMLSAALAQVFPSTFTGVCMTVIIVGTNDLANHTGNLSTFETNLKSLIATAAAKGPVVFSQIYPAGLTFTNANFVADMAQFNSDAAANWRAWGASGLITVTGSSEIYGSGTAADATFSYFCDSAHLNDSGNSVFARYALAAIIPLLNQPGPLALGYPTPAQIAASILATPANLLATNSSGAVALPSSATMNIAGNLSGSVGSVTTPVPLPSTATMNIAGNLSGSVGSVTNTVNLPASATMNIAGNITGNLSGSVGSVASAVTLPSTAPAGYGGASPSAVATAVWQDPANSSDFQSAGSVGQLVSVSLPNAALGTAGGIASQGTLSVLQAQFLSLAGAVQLTGHAVTLPPTATMNILGNLSGSVGSVTAAVPLPATTTMNITGNLTGSVGSVGSAVTLPTPAPAGYGGSSSSGTGPIALNQNTGGVDALRYVDATGNGIPAANILIYLATDWPANPADVQAQSTTGPDGRWLTPAYVSHGTYVAVFTKPAADGPDVSALFTV